MCYIINTFKKLLRGINSSLNDIVRVRIFVVNIGDWEQVGKAFSEYFRTIKPAATLVGVNALINPELLVEIEASAIISGED